MARFAPIRRRIKSPGNPLTGAGNVVSYARRAARNLGRAPAYQSGSYVGRILFDEYNKTKAADTRFSDAKKNMNKRYTKDAITKIHKRYMKKPKEMDKALEQLTTAFVKDYNFFLAAYHKVFDLILQTMITAQADHYGGLKSFDEIVQKVDYIAQHNPHKLYFSLDRFEREFKIAIKDLVKQLRRDYTNVKKLAVGKRYALGYISRFIRKRKSEMRERRAIPQLVSEIESFKESGNIITAQIDSGNLKQNFIAYLLDYIYKLEKLDDTLKNLKTDVERIMQKILQEAEETIEKISPFLKIIQNDLDPKVRIQMEINAANLQAYHISIMNFLARDTWPKYTLDEVSDIYSHGRDLIRILRQDISATMTSAVQEAKEKHFA